MDMCPVNCRPRSSSFNNKSTGYPSNNVNFSSLPLAPSVQHDYTVVQRSFSFGGRTAKRSESSSRFQSRATAGLNHIAKRQRPNSIHPKIHLTHSQSAPSIGLDPWRKRRHSLQHIDSYGRAESWEVDTEADGINPRGRAYLRRTSSEVYVDRGEYSVNGGSPKCDDVMMSLLEFTNENKSKNFVIFSHSSLSCECYSSYKRWCWVNLVAKHRFSFY